jgi:hypothetical protein
MVNDRSPQAAGDRRIPGGATAGTLHDGSAPDAQPRGERTRGGLALILTLLPGDETPQPARRRWLQLILRSLLVGYQAEP